MRWIAQLRLKTRSLFRRTQVERELDEELEYHLQRLIDDSVASGLSERDARHHAMREMGRVEPRKEECRDARGFTWLDSLGQDLAYAVRAFRKSPGFSIVAVLSLAISIGATTTIFSFVNAVVLRPLPYPASERLVVLHEHKLGTANPVNVHPASFLEWQLRARSFESLVLVQAPPLNVMGASGAEQVVRLQTTADLFRVFAVDPSLGRTFDEADTRAGGQNVVILGYGFWQRWFGGDPAVIGRRLPIQDGALEIVGVAPRGFHIGLIEPDVFTPLTIDRANPAATGSRAFQSYGRLKPGVSLDTARAEMIAIGSTLRSELRLNEGMGVLVSGLHEYLARDARPGLRLLMAVVATVLAIACVNIAGLLMARGLVRRHELALRAALGASRRRIVRQLVVESFVLSLLGGGAGLALAYVNLQAVAALAGRAMTASISEPVRLDPTCLVFTFLVTMATTVVCGLVPARQASRVDPQSALREQTRSATADRSHHRVRRALVVTQVALAIVLLVGAGLLVRTLASLTRIDLGFEPAGTVTMGLFLGVRPPEARIATVDQILDRVEALPGVKAAGTIQFLPLGGATCGTGFWFEDHAGPRDPARMQPTDCSLVSRGYFAAMGIPLLEGRVFDRSDRLGSPRVVLVNQSFAKQYLRDGQGTGRRVFVQGSNQALAEIVGVVGDVRHSGLTSEPAPMVFLLHAQTPGYITNLVVRVSSDPLAHAAAVQRAIHDVDPTQAVSGVRTLETDVARVMARPRLYALVVAGFALIAAMLASIGVYGLVAYVVAQRHHEIGIRLALGATRRDVFLGVLRQGAEPVAAGLVLGILAAIGLRQIVASLVFGVAPGDPVTYLLVGLAFLTVALTAVAIPARRASRVEPLAALRSE